MEEQQLPQDTAYVDAVIDRLRACYLARPPLPAAAAVPLTVAGFYRCYRAVLTEGYEQGEAGQKRRMAAGRGGCVEASPIAVLPGDAAASG
jgi:hypothetical protein